MSDVYDDTLRLTLQRDLDRFEKAGMTEESKRVKARLAGLDKELAGEESPKKTAKKTPVKED